MDQIYSVFQKKAKRSTLTKSYSQGSKDTSKAPQVYDSCSELPLYNFIKVIITGDLKWLSKKGEPTSQQLSEAWSAIFMEYCDIAPTNNSTYVVQITREIRHLESKINIIQSIIERLTISYVPELVEILKEYGFYYSFTPDTMYDDLQGVIAESKQFVVQKGVKEGEYQRFLDDQKGDSASENDWDELLSELGKFQGYHLKSKDLSVSEFVGIFNRFKKQNGKQPADR